MAHLPSANDIYDAYIENAAGGGDDDLFSDFSDRLHQQTHMRRMDSDPSRSPRSRAITNARNEARTIKRQQMDS